MQYRQYVSHVKVHTSDKYELKAVSIHRKQTSANTEHIMQLLLNNCSMQIALHWIT